MNPTKFIQEYASQVNFANNDDLVFDTKNPSKFSTKQLSLIKALGKPLKNFKKAKFNSEVGIYDIEDDLFYDTSTKGSSGVVKRVYNKPRNPTGKTESVYSIISVHKDPIHYEILDRKNEVLLTDDNDKPLVFINKGKARAWMRQKPIESGFNTNMAINYSRIIARKARKISQNFAKIDLYDIKEKDVKINSTLHALISGLLNSYESNNQNKDEVIKNISKFLYEVGIDGNFEDYIDMIFTYERFDMLNDLE